MNNRRRTTTTTAERRNGRAAANKEQTTRDKEREAIEKLVDLFVERYGPALKELEKH